MHLTDIRIDEIVKVDGLPSYARGRATFDNGRSYPFDANFAHGYAEARIVVRRPTDGKAMDPATRTLLQVSIEDAADADRAFTELMGDLVQPRKEWIQAHARQVKNLDI